MRDGLLVLDGDQPTTCRSAQAFDEFELHFQYRFEAGQEAVFSLDANGSESGFGLGYLTSRPSEWNEGLYAQRRGTSKAEFHPLRPPLLHLGPAAGPVQGIESAGLVHITFKLAFPGSRLALRTIKIKQTGRPAADRHEK